MLSLSCISTNLFTIFLYCAPVGLIMHHFIRVMHVLPLSSFCCIHLFMLENMSKFSFFLLFHEIFFWNGIYAFYKVKFSKIDGFSRKEGNGSRRVWKMTSSPSAIPSRCSVSRKELANKSTWLSSPIQRCDLTSMSNSVFLQPSRFKGHKKWNEKGKYPQEKATNVNWKQYMAVVLYLSHGFL